LKQDGVGVAAGDPDEVEQVTDQVAEDFSDGFGLTVSASTSLSPFDGTPTIATLRVDLGRLWSASPLCIARDLP
jgi:hypothetical protein